MTGMVLILALISCAYGLYEDQVGLHDWSQQYVGAVKTKVTSSRRVYMSTHLSILAAVDLRSGEVAWRHKFTLGDSIVDGPLLSGDVVATRHATGQLRYWDCITGILVSDVAGKDIVQLVPLSDGSFLIVRLNSVTVGGPSSSNSYVVDIPAGFSSLGYIKSSSDVQVLLSDGQTSLVLSYIPGQPIRTAALSLPSGLIFLDDLVASLDGTTLHYLNMGADSFQTVELADIGVNQPVNSIKSAGRSLLIGTGEKGSVFINFRGGIPRAVKVIEKEAIAQVVGNDQMIMMYDNTVSLVQISNGFVHHSYTLEANRGDVISITPLSVSHPCTTISTVKVPGVLLTWSDQSVMVTGDTDSCTWIREESLASVTTATLMDLPSISLNPLTHQRSTSGNPFTAWVDRIYSQFLDFNKMINIYFGTAHVDASPDMERDSFNLNKLIVTITTVGKVHVLHSKSGRLVCSRLISEIKPFDTGKYQMYVTRTSSHYPLSANVVILASSLNGTNTVLTVINPIDCSIEYRHQFPSKLMQAQLTPIVDEDYSKILVLLTEDKKVHTFPPHSSLASVPLFFTILNGQTLTGYKVVEVSSTVEETWSTHVRGDSVLSVVSKDQNDEVYSQGRALGDRSVLHKYINPNVMAIAVESTDKGHVDILVYDMVTGEQVYFSRHKQYSGPAHLLLSENWMVYHLWNSKLRRYEVTVVEFYLETPPKVSEFSSLNSQYKISSLQQSYISISPMNTLETTTTLKSITNRAILFAETGGRIAVVPKALLDPRRPAKPTAADKMEGLLPYSPQIVVPPISYLTFNKTLMDIRGMTTGVTGLESTSILFSYGTDLFFTRVTPAKTFDMLNEDFDYSFIGLVLVGLCLATIFTHAMADNKALNKKWK